MGLVLARRIGDQTRIMILTDDGRIAETIVVDVVELHAQDCRLWFDAGPKTLILREELAVALERTGTLQDAIDRRLKAAEQRETERTRSRKCLKSKS